MLKYDEQLGGYRVNITKEQLENAPRYGEDDSWDWASAEYNQGGRQQPQQNPAHPTRALGAGPRRGGQCASPPPPHPQPDPE